MSKSAQLQKTEEEIVKELLSDLVETFLVLRPSPIHGIGVFAIRDIPRGTRAMFSKDNGEWIKLPIKEIQLLPDYSQELIKSYCVFDNDFYYVEKYAFKKMDLANFLNHSENPNIIPINDGEFFEAISDIRPGDELLINYSELSWPGV
ncbi:MAG: SET domain-containing protein [Bacteroidota bacterium]|nr:SET domain-containing protein [Bacteroidota bacterium]